MSKLQKVQLDDNTVIYIEGEEEQEKESAELPEAGERKLREGRRNGETNAAVSRFQSIRNTIRAYTNQSLNAFRGITGANVDRVTLEFGIRVGGEGSTYVTSGTANSNIKVTVECSFPR